MNAVYRNRFMKDQIYAVSCGDKTASLSNAAAL